MFDFRLARFAIVGLVNTFTGLLVIYTCMGLLGMGDIPSNMLGYGVGILVGFVLNKRWSFEHRGDPAGTFARYLGVLVFAYLANLATTIFAIEMLHLNSYIAQAAGILPYALATYVGARVFVFRRDEAASEELARPF